ncbi:MAG: response regulator, partial [Deltaproteobacteria bacterium]|nr:response regulator [Deltaproteobacteria bacterium]
IPMVALSALILLASLGATEIHTHWRSAAMGVATCLAGMSLVAEPAAVGGFLVPIGLAFCAVVACLWAILCLIRPSFGEPRERGWLVVGGFFWLLCWTIDLVDPPVHVAQIELFFVGLMGWATCITFVLAIRNEEARLMMEGLSNELEVKNRDLSELDRLKDEFLAKTSHELRTPLNGIIGLSESLLDGVGGPLEPRMRRNITMIEQSGKRLSHLVNDILDFSKLRNRRISLERIPVSLFSAVEMVVELSRPLIGDKTMDVYNVVSVDLPPVLADPNRLQQILFNLVGNAIKFTEKGYVTIRAEHNTGTGQIAIAVEDSGIGIALQYRERIFRAFEQGDGTTQREHGGTGLGLAVSRELVVAHGGELQVDSALGMGTTMSFSLPVAEGEPKWLGRTLGAKGIPADSLDAEQTSASITAGNQYPEGPEHGQCVAIVDDEEVNREVVALQVSGEGYPVVAFESGAKVLSWIEANGPPAVLLLDVMMPGLSGLDVLVQIRKEYSLQELPVLLLTARGTDGDMTEGFAAGANDYLVKPFSRPELLNRLRHHLGFTAMSSMLRSTNKVLEAELSKRHEMEGSLAQMRLRQEEAEKEIGALQGNLQDLSLRTSRVKSKLLQAEKLASLGQMMAGVAMSLSEPILSITKKLEDLRSLLGESVERIVPYLERAEADADSFQESLDILMSHIENMEIGADMVKKITRAMMNYDPAAHGEQQDTVMADLVSDCLTICGFRLRGFEVDVDLDEVCSVPAHRTHLAQVISNLLSNAVDALNEREGEDLATPRIRVLSQPKLHEGVEGVVIDVEDNGPGVPPDFARKVFLPFFTTRPVGKGTGIGLAVSKRIVDDHNGFLSVDDSEHLGGARFRLWLPRVREKGATK